MFRSFSAKVRRILQPCRIFPVPVRGWRLPGMKPAMRATSMAKASMVRSLLGRCALPAHCVDVEDSNLIEGGRCGLPASRSAGGEGCVTCTAIMESGGVVCGLSPGGARADHGGADLEAHALARRAAAWSAAGVDPLRGEARLIGHVLPQIPHSAACGDHPALCRAAGAHQQTGTGPSLWPLRPSSQHAQSAPLSASGAAWPMMRRGSLPIFNIGCKK